MGSVTIGIIIIIQAIICSALSMTLADYKNYNSTSWGLIGFCFGILGLIAAAGLPKKETFSFDYSNIVFKECPQCKEKIHTEAKICKYCGSKFNDEDIKVSLIDNLNNFKSLNFDQKIFLIERIGDKKIIEAIPLLVQNLIAVKNINEKTQLEINKKIFSVLDYLNSSSCVPLLIDRIDENIVLDKQISQIPPQVITC